MKSNDLLDLEASAASLRIRALRDHRHSIEWKVKYSYTTSAKGRIEVDDQMLSVMFGLTDHLESDLRKTMSQWLLDLYGGTVAYQGHFIRYNDFLSIPCPGTGHDGDPNVSIEIDDRIREGVKQLLHPVH